MWNRRISHYELTVIFKEVVVTCFTFSDLDVSSVAFTLWHIQAFILCNKRKFASTKTHIYFVLSLEWNMISKRSAGVKVLSVVEWEETASVV
jgi:hypothetical protein